MNVGNGRVGQTWLFAELGSVKTLILPDLRFNRRIQAVTAATRAKTSR
jgi:hypothetical protein